MQGPTLQPDSGHAVTSFGRENILRTKKVIDDIGTIYVINGDVVFKDKMIFGKTVAKGYDLSVVYGDTDSVFVRLKLQSQGRRLSLWMMQS